MRVSIKKNIYTVLVIGLALNFIYASLCHAVSGINVCLMNCCDKSIQSDRSSYKIGLDQNRLFASESNCCLYEEGEQTPFLTKGVFNFKIDSSRALLAPMTERIPLESKVFFTLAHRQDFSLSPTLYLINHSFLC